VVDQLYCKYLLINSCGLRISMPWYPEVVEFSCGRLFPDIDVMDDGGRGALPAPFQHGRDALVLALEYGFHPAVGEISDPAGEVERQGGFQGVCPEANALYPA
jgi:hypothetical protein